MPRTTIGGDDPAHELPKEEKDQLERKLREDATHDPKSGKPKDARAKLNRAINISRPPSRKAQHH
jgi:hypothetical protein